MNTNNRIRSGKIQFSCTEPFFPEFPDLMFGRLNDAVVLFDGTAYLQKINTKAGIADFFNDCERVILVFALSQNVEVVFYKNDDNHILIDANFVYIFLSYFHPEFLTYILNSFNQMFSTGICVSDTYLLQQIKTRFDNAETVIKMLNG